MTPRLRRRLFYILCVLFLLVSISVILYAEGWRIDPKTFHIEKDGAILVRPFPASANIFLDGASIQNQTSFINQNTVVADLFPKNYELTLKAPGYDNWTETAAVLPSRITEMQYAVLVPQNATSVAPTMNVSNFFEANGLIGVQNQNKIIIFGSTIIGNGTILDHTNANLLWKSASGEYMLYDFTNAQATDLSLLLETNGTNINAITSVTLDPYNPGFIMATTPARVWVVSVGQGTASPVRPSVVGVAVEPPIAFSQSLFAWSTFQNALNTSEITIYDPFTSTVSNPVITFVGKIQKTSWIKNNMLGILAADGSLYSYDVPSETLSKIANDVRNFYPSPDGTLVATLEHQSIEIMGANEYYRFNVPNINSLTNLIWYKDDTHLFLQYNDRISFLDFADTGLRNLTTVSLGAQPFYDPQGNNLYLIDQGHKLLRFDFPS